MQQIQSLLHVHRCKDFLITGMGDHEEWQKSEWTDLIKLDSDGENYLTQFKILYSSTGIYVLFNGEDSMLSSDYESDFDELFKGDVFEIFFHPNPSARWYFEYEINAFGKELILLMLKGQNYLSGWAPWPYNENNSVLKSINIQNGKPKAFTSIDGWSAEIFIPYRLLKAFENTPPEKGIKWNANFCRLDYDTGKMVKWAWAPVETSFHETDRYFSLIFA